jgi:hypothetical protein
LNTWAGNLTDVSVIPDSNSLGVTTNYMFYFTTTNQIPVNGKITIYFPITVYGTISSVSCSASNNIDTSMLCYISSNIITIYDGYNTTALTGGS